MKYNIGNKVKIVSKEFLTGTANLLVVEKYLESLSPKRILTIDRIFGDLYFMKKNDWGWYEDEVECLAREEIFDPVENRFEILDL